jgi:hypothetical protein
MRILSICSVPFFYYMRVYHRCFSTPAYMGRRELEAEFFSSCPCLALVPGVGGYVLAGAEIEGWSCIFLYFCGCCSGGCVCACIRACSHAHYLRYSMWAQEWNGHLKSQKNPERLKRCIHLNRICQCVHHTLTYITWGKHINCTLQEIHNLACRYTWILGLETWRSTHMISGNLHSCMQSCVCALTSFAWSLSTQYMCTCTHGCHGRALVYYALGSQQNCAYVLPCVWCRNFS